MGKFMTESTFCSFLWEEIFINDKGAVYSCCHQEPKKLGSIYDEPLREIVNNQIIKRYRQQSLDGRLKCHKNCSLLGADKYADPHGAIQASYNGFKRLKILFGEGCNINCVMCWQNSNAKRQLDIEVLKRQVDITPFEQIDLQGGEPLFLPSAKAFYDHCAQQGKPITFLTNGTIMTPTWAQKIARHSPYISISLNAGSKEVHQLVNRGSNWERVMRTIEMLQDARAKAGSSLELAGHMTIVWQNVHEIPLFIEKFREFGFDRIKFGFDFRVPWYLRMKPALAKELKRTVPAAIAAHPHKQHINTERLELLGLV